MSPKSIFPETITPRTISPKTIPPRTMRPQAPARPRAGAAWATLCRGALQLGGGLTIALALQSSLPEQAAAQFAPPPLPASEEPADAKPRTPIVPQTEEFKQATEDFREHLKEMRAVWVRYHVDLDGEEDKRRKKEWNQLYQSGMPIYRRMIQGALREYQADPEGRPELADLLWETLENNAEKDLYEGMLEVAEALAENNYPNEKLPGLLSMTAFALNNFDLAESQLSQMSPEDAANPQVVSLREGLEKGQRLWQEELKAREKDAQGEPLPRVLIHTTKGDVEVELFENQAPESVGNFIHLVESGFYEGLLFHRVLDHFMAQTGCPVGDGSGGPGYNIYGEMNKPDARNFFRGTLGVALAQSPNSGGSQFFICYVPAYHLNGNYTAFGRVLSGMEVLANLVRINPDDKKDESKPAEMPDEILSIEVLQKRDHEYKPHKVK